MSENLAKLDVLFVSEKPLWPLDQGYRIRGSNLSAALETLGLRVGVACMQLDTLPAPSGMNRRLIDWPTAVPAADHLAFLQAWSGIGEQLRLKVASHQGVDLTLASGVRTLVRQHQPRVVVAMGQHGPLLLRGLHDLPCQCVWYAADELLRFQMSCMMKEPITRWPSRLRQMAVYGALENAFVRGLHGAIAVSPLDATLLRTVAGARHVAMIRNGVDLDYFHPRLMPPPRDASLVFWGRLDFEPNIDAVHWFANKVWRKLLQHRPEARWTIVGKFPHPSLDTVRELPGVTLLENVPDIRPHAHGSSLTILPMRCGGGIKNKLLEAAAMALPIVASPRAMQGLAVQPGSSPAHVCHDVDSWVHDIVSLWNNPQTLQSMGKDARAWASEHHSWNAAALQFARWTGLSISHNEEHNPLREAA